MSHFAAATDEQPGPQAREPVPQQPDMSACCSQTGDPCACETEDSRAERSALARRLFIAFLLAAGLSAVCWKVLPVWGVSIPPAIPLIVYALIVFSYFLTAFQSARERAAAGEEATCGSASDAEAGARPLGCCGPRPVGETLRRGGGCCRG